MSLSARRVSRCRAIRNVISASSARPVVARGVSSSTSSQTSSSGASSSSSPSRPHPKEDEEKYASFSKRLSSVGGNRYITRIPEETISKQHLVDSRSANTSTPTASSFTLAVKDNIATLGGDGTTTCASAILQSHISPFEATIVGQLRACGAVVVGKTNLDEFGMGSHSTHSHFGVVMSPREKEQEKNQEEGGDAEEPMDDRSVGGSSGGSAVAVRLGDADIGLGTDTGGSIRLPAAYNGVVGFKPSYGVISRYGVVPYANSLDTVGFLTKDAATIRALFTDERVRQHDPLDPTSVTAAARKRYDKQRASSSSSSSSSSSQMSQEQLRKLVFGVPLEYNIEELSETVREAWRRAIDRLESLGCRVVPVSLPTTKHALSAYYTIAPAEASSNLAKYDGVRYGTRVGESDAEGGSLYAATRGAGFGEEVQRRILLGAYTLSSEAMDNYFIQAAKVRRLVVRDFDRVFKLANPLHEPEQYDLSELHPDVELDDKRGPPQVDFLLCPTAPTLAPKLEDVKASKSPVDAYMNDVFTVPASLAGVPAISFPAARSPNDDLDISPSMQLIGQYWDDSRLLSTAELVASSLVARQEVD